MGTKRITKHIRLKLSPAAREFGVNLDKLRNCVSKAIHDELVIASDDGTQTIRDYFVALYGDESAKKLEKLTIETEQAAHDLAVSQRKVIDREECVKFILETFSPLREFMVSLPGQLSAVVNPADPAHARAHLQRAVDDFLRLKPKLPPSEK